MATIFSITEEQRRYLTKNFSLRYGTPPVYGVGGSWLPFGTLDDETFDMFPQYLQWVALGSGSLMRGINKYATFLFGGGFEDEIFAKSVINDKGQTANNLLASVCVDYALYKNVALHIGYNGLCQIANIWRTPFESVRIGTPLQNGDICHMFVLHKYDKYRKGGIIQYIPEKFHVFNPDSETVRAQIEQSGGMVYNQESGCIEMAFKGQLLYMEYGDNFNQYYRTPLYIPSLQDAESEAALSLGIASELQGGWAGRVHINKIGTAEPSNVKKEEDKAFYGNSLGANGNPAIIDYSIDAESATKITTIPRENPADGYSWVSTHLSESILQHFNVPADLLAFKEGASIFNSPETIANQLAYLQKTELYKGQQELSQMFARIFANWHGQSFTNFNIKNFSL
ncbi:MAG: hypothetical protein ACRCXN_13065 [Bacteroidales bacterium]